MHWAFQYIGLKHKKGGRTKDGLDCWGLVRIIYWEKFGLKLPELPGISEQSAIVVAGSIQSNIATEWEEVVTPFDGCAVAMSQRGEVMHHVGVYTSADGGKIIHCWAEQNVIADTVRGLELKGFQTIKFYRHRLWHLSLKSPTVSTHRTSRNIGLAPALLSVAGLRNSILGS